MRTGFLLTLTMLLGVIPPVCTFAADATPLADRIGVIDLDKVSERLTASDKSVNALRDKIKRISTDFTTKKRKADDLEEEQIRMKGVFSREEQDKKQKEINQLHNEMEDLNAQANREIKLMQDTVLTPLQKKIEFAIEDVAKQKHIDFIFKADQLAFAIRSSDISEQVIARISQMDQATNPTTDATTATASTPSSRESVVPPPPDIKSTPKSAKPIRPVDRQAD